MKHRPPKFANPGAATKPLARPWQQWHEQARAHLTAGRHADALPLLERAMKAAPESHAVQQDLARTYFHLGRVGDALREFNELGIRFPHSAEIASNIAGLLSLIGEQVLALQMVERALTLQPTNHSALNNLAEILKHLGNWEGARDVYREALAHSPTSAKLHMQLGMTLVGLGDWVSGYAEMEFREDYLGASLLFRERSTMPRWTGVEPLVGKTILVQHEQGNGDSIMCARFARELAALGARVIVRCPPPLVALISTIPGVSACSAVGTPLPEHDLHVPLMSLMACLRVRGEDLDGVPYLFPEGALPEAVAERLPDDGVVTVALAWAGNPLHSNDHRRSIPGEALRDLLATPGVRFVAMQKTPNLDTALPHDLHPFITDIGAHCRTFADSAHALRRVDLVVSVDSAVAHLSGALGVPTLVCVPFTPDYRWGVSGERTPWYRSLTLLRQQEAMQWGDVLQQVQQRVVALRDVRAGLATPAAA